MMRRDQGVMTFVWLAALLACGCGGGTSARPPLRVAAASDLQSALPVLAKQFTDQTGVELTLTFGASGQLSEQIRGGAPFDVFLAANQSFVSDLAREGLIRPESVKPYARGSLVLVVHRESGGSMTRLADLTRPEVKKIALANPESAPYGKAGKQALERAGLWAEVSPRIVQSESVRQALQFVQEGNAEAGLVGRAIADVPKVRIVEVDPGLYDPIIQGLGVVSASKRRGDAEHFATFVLGEQGQTGLARFGFSTPAVTPAPPGESR